MRQAVKDRMGITVAVIVSDTFGRPWRNAAADVAIGVAGIDPVYSYVGQLDNHGHEMFTTEIAVADELAAAGELVSGKVDGVPVSIIRGYQYTPMEDASIQRILRGGEKDLFR
jgi:coenzyme F420-0:L-glutamate ligase/coenzyme F420-1:gamma-L-glutamate ligase